MSGKFYVLKHQDGRYLRHLLANGRPIFCDSFARASKFFDVDLRGESEIYNCAQLMGCEVQVFLYDGTQVR